MYADRDAFTSAVRRFAELRSDGLAWLIITPDGNISIEVDGEAEGAPEPGDGLYMDVADALTAIASEASIEEFVEARSARRPVFGGPEEPEVSRAKYEAAEAAFPMAALSTRSWLHTTSKVPVLVNVEWELLFKVADSEADTPEGSAPNFLYAHLRLEAQGKPNSFLPDHRELVFAVDLEDTNALIRQLQHLRTALQQPEESIDGDG